jgi:Tol biopolymer transport system component
MRANGTDAHPSTLEGDGYAPDWSPNGCWIAFNSQRSGNSEIYMMRSGGSDVRRLTTTQSEEGEPGAACCAAWRPEKSQQSAA